jgi:AcrR family transcriptional regulator
MASTKKDKQREQTYQNLIETAERLFAEHGIAAVSLRQIGLEAGSLNTNVVGYYFGTKESLIDAIYNYRIPHIEKLRAKILAELDENQQGMAFVELLRATWLPLFELRDKNGNHSYARFLLSVQRAGLGWTRNVLNPQYPVAYEIFRRIQEVLTKNSVVDMEFKIIIQMNMMVSSLEYIDEKRMSRKDSLFIFNESILMTCAALLTSPENV